MEKMNTKQMSLPIAIIIAGALIAGAIVLTKKSPSQVSNATNPLEMVLDLAAKAGAKESSVKACIEKNETKDRVARDADNGIALGVQGTPYNIIIVGNDKFAVPGAFPQAYFEKVISIMQKGTPRSADTFASDDIENIYNYVMSHDALPKITGEKLDALMPIDAEDHVRGSTNAQITVIEYSDLQCPFCQAHHATLQALEKEYGDQFAWVYRHLPLVSIHDTAQIRSEAAECVAKAKGNDAFWKFVDANFAQKAQ